MSHAALTARYRPQTFAQVAGQDTIKTILSRASLEGKVAPAYLFSGTRGVGKTTLARIFAKALNCRTAPTAEPCNQCDQCRAITAGNAVDVVEIDGASNRGIDDVRRLKEVVGYAPMEGAYKIFIIDEAHMLSREAFNALLKTLEEPPARVTFIMATTEPHKFPATIISRCQHYVFKRLPESGLTDHLASVLQQEGLDYEENALRLLARRGAGSVRDSMSLLGQVLALGEGRLTEETARNVLGLAGQEAFLSLLEAFRSGDSVRISRLLRGMLDQGLDMGFFLRELASLWRNLFMLRQSGEAALPVVELPEKEARACLEMAKEFSLQHIHACWQMTLDGQRRVLASLEPALALELLLLNIAMLPKLLSLENFSALGRRQAPNPNSGSPGEGSPDGSAPASSSSPATPSGNASPQGPGSAQAGAAPQRPASGNASPDHEESLSAAPAPFPPESVPPEAGEYDSAILWDTPPEDPFQAPEAAEAWQPATEAGSPEADIPPEPAVPATAPADTPLPDWASLLSLAEERQTPVWLLQLLRRARAEKRGQGLLLTAQDDFSAERIAGAEVRECLRDLFIAACGFMPELEIKGPEKKRKTRDDLRAEILEHPLVREAEAHLGASIIDYGQLH